MSIFQDSLDSFLAPVKAYLEDDTVSEVLINGPNEIFIEKKGLLEKVTAQFHDDQTLVATARNIAQFVGRKIDDENPTLDARLPDGSRIHAVLMPQSSGKGAVISIRKFSRTSPNFVDLINKGSVTKDAARFLDICIYLAKNLIISGGTGSGKTTLLNVLGSRIPGTQRLLIIEDAHELKIKTDHVVYFETRAPLPNGKGALTVRELIKSSLRLRPDRIVVGEVRGPEALDLITAMNTGHGGSMGTTHANTPLDALVRLETLSMMADTQVPVQAIRRQIASAINIVVQIKRLHDGSRKITDIAEVIPDVDEHGRYQIKNIYQYVIKGKDAQGHFVGELVATGYVPSFFNEIVINRLPFGKEKFAPPAWFDPKKIAA